jgi:hypothetical protein
MSTSSAAPAALLAYARAAQQLDRELRTDARRTEQRVQAFLDSGPDFGGRTANAAAGVVAHADRNAEADAWVGRVGERFLLADRGGGWLGGLLAVVAGLADPTRVVTVDATALDAAGWPSHQQAQDAGRAFAADVIAGLDGDPDDLDAATLEAWRDRLAVHQHDAAFTSAFFNALGPERTLRIPLAVELHYAGDEIGNPAWGLDVLRPFSIGLATAMEARHRLPARFALTDHVVDGILDHRPGYDPDEPQEHHQALLFSAGTFPTGILLRLGENVVGPGLASTFRSGPFGFTPWGWGADPVAIGLAAIARNPDAAGRFLAADRSEYVDARSNLELLLTRYAHDLDGDGGRAAADLLRAALTDPDHRRRSQDLFDEAMRHVQALGEVRNGFHLEPLADAAAFHIRHLTELAANEAGGENHEQLTAARDLLRHVLADDASAARVYEAAFADLYDRVGAARPGDTLSSEAWDTGSLLGLLLRADALADVEATEDRIARRQALLDGIAQVTDLGLTFTSGRWIPFATAGRDHLLDGFRLDGELDETLADVDAFENRLRAGITQLFVVRLAQQGELDVPAGVVLKPRDEMTEAQRAAFDRWVDSPEVHDAVGSIRFEAGQRMDEVEDALDGDG